MNREQMVDLKKGNEVKYVADKDFERDLEDGSILTRVPHWLDDDSSVMFEYDYNGYRVDHFFNPEELAFV